MIDETMKLLVIPSTNHLDVLVGNLEYLYAAHEYETDMRQDGPYISVAFDDADIIDAALHTTHIPGVDAAAVALPCTDDPADVAATAQSAFDTESTFTLDAERYGDVVRNALESEGHSIDPEADDDLVIRCTDEQCYIYLDPLDGIGGQPVGTMGETVVLMEDRPATVAAYRLMRAGHKVWPVTNTAKPALEEEMKILKQFDPQIKLTTVKKEQDAALQQVCDLHDVDCVAFGATADDELPEYTGEEDVIFPNKNESLEEVLTIYGNLQHVTI